MFYVFSMFYNVLIFFSEICSFPNNWTGKWFHLGFPGVNLINILRLPFLYKSALRSFSIVIVWLYKIFGAKAAHKMLMKLTTEPLAIGPSSITGKGACVKMSKNMFLMEER